MSLEDKTTEKGDEGITFEDIEGKDSEFDFDSGDMKATEFEDAEVEKEAETKTTEKPEAKVEKVVTTPVKETTTEQAKAKEETGKITDKEAQKIREDVLSVVGEDAVLKIRGKQYPVKDLSAGEIQKYVQQGMRFYQAMDEVAQEKRQLAEREQLVTRGAQQVQQLLTQYGGQFPGRPQEKASLPEELRPNEFDSPEVKGLKTMVGQLQTKVDALEHGQERQSYAQREQTFLREIENLKADYPCASEEVVIACKALYPDTPVEHLMAKSHGHYASPSFVESVFKHNPDLERQFEEKAVAKYLAKKSKAPGIPLKKSSGSAGKVLREEKKPEVTFDNVGSLVKSKLRKLEAAIAEEENE